MVATSTALPTTGFADEVGIPGVWYGSCAVGGYLPGASFEDGELIVKHNIVYESFEILTTHDLVS
jgi:hypothetical protein